MALEIVNVVLTLAGVVTFFAAIVWWLMWWGALNPATDDQTIMVRLPGAAEPVPLDQVRGLREVRTRPVPLWLPVALTAAFVATAGSALAIQTLRSERREDALMDRAVAVVRESRAGLAASGESLDGEYLTRRFADELWTLRLDRFEVDYTGDTAEIRAYSRAESADRARRTVVERRTVDLTG